MGILTLLRPLYQQVGERHGGQSQFNGESQHRYSQESLKVFVENLPIHYLSSQFGIARMAYRVPTV